MITPLSIKGVITRIVSLRKIRYFSSFPVASERISAFLPSLLLRKQKTINKSAISTPAPVPSAEPMAPSWARLVGSAPTAVCIRSQAAAILTTAFASCSRICETLVWTMLPLA